MSFTRKFVTAIFPMALVISVLCAVTPAQTKRAITFDDLIGMHRVGDPQISPDGKWVSYTVTTPDKAANRSSRNIWLVPLAGGPSAPLGDSAARQLTRSGRDSHARWSPDGRKLAFISTRDGGAQIYWIALEGGEASKLTSISTGVEWFSWAPDGKSFAFASRVYPDCKDDACNSKRDKDAEASKVKARIYDNLLYRHWTDWWDYKRSHLFVAAVEAGPAVPAPRDLTPGAEFDVPPVQRGGSEPIAWSPDSKELAYGAVTERMEATSTNADVFLVPAAGGTAKRITTNPGFDSDPVYSPDGKWIAYRSQPRAGYEADKWRVMLYDRASGAHAEVTSKWDRSADSLAWAPDSRSLYFNGEDRAQAPVFMAAAAAGAEVKTVVASSYNGEFTLSADGKTLVMSRQSAAMPAELFAANAGPSAALGTGERQLTRHNAERLAQLDLSPAEHFWFDSADGARVHGMVVRPPGFSAAKKYPLLLVAHGGPQTQFSDAWSYRWNAQMLAAPGYVVLMINRRGSTGFGQKFTDEIEADWGGKAYQDLMKGLEVALARYSFADGTRVAAAGASYGGYMMAWMASQSKGRFKAIVCHAGVYNLESEYGATEELWFPEKEYRGTPWTSKAVYDQWSPHLRAAEFGKYKTPTLVIHGELDFRVPYTQGLEFFTALQRQGVPSKLLIYPDEGHWILKPQNSELWYKTVHEWLAAYLK